ncbi:hypothetical protein E4T52_05900 [Aureobasidium sp. EXF-3400]|nr:hypothetical protein E4T51_03779 [Aureobasidium sp. EXF-12344]KAI4779150.1 hypothetical protein E4T52_05900 [Aureobasidium sp. EXF-3400]
MAVATSLLQDTTAMTTLWLGCAVVCTVYLVGLVVYRLYFHPLCKFPGPFWCRISHFQQCYYEAICGGKFIYQIPKYHERYGMLRSLANLVTD